MNNAVVGENCIVGANALVTENKKFPPGSLILGSPAKVVRQLTDSEINQLATFAEHYVEKITRYKNTLHASN